jgi:hypothetical protein
LAASILFTFSSLLPGLMVIGFGLALAGLGGAAACAILLRADTPPNPGV